MDGLPDDSTTLAIKIVAGIFGLSATIVAWLTAAAILHSYLAPARFAARAATGAAGFTARAIRFLWRSPFGFLLALVLTAFSLIGQVLAVGLCYLGAAAAELWFSPRRLDDVTYAVNTYGLEALLPSHARDFLQPDWFTIGYAVAAAVILLWCYRGAAAGSDHSVGGGALMAGPVVLMLGQALFALALMAFFTVFVVFWWVLTRDGLSDWLDSIGLGALVLTIEAVVCAMFWLACWSAARSCTAVVDAWSPAGTRTSHSASRR